MRNLRFFNQLGVMSVLSSKDLVRLAFCSKEFYCSAAFELLQRNDDDALQFQAHMVTIPTGVKDAVSPLIRLVRSQLKINPVAEKKILLAQLLAVNEDQSVLEAAIAERQPDLNSEDQEIRNVAISSMVILAKNIQNYKTINSLIHAVWSQRNEALNESKILSLTSLGLLAKNTNMGMQGVRWVFDKFVAALSDRGEGVSWTASVMITKAQDRLNNNDRLWLILKLMENINKYNSEFVIDRVPCLVALLPDSKQVELLDNKVVKGDGGTDSIFLFSLFGRHSKLPAREKAFQVVASRLTDESKKIRFEAANNLFQYDLTCSDATILEKLVIVVAEIVSSLDWWKYIRCLLRDIEESKLKIVDKKIVSELINFFTIDQFMDTKEDFTSGLRIIRAITSLATQLDSDERLIPVVDQILSAWAAAIAKFKPKVYFSPWESIAHGCVDAMPKLVLLIQDEKIKDEKMRICIKQIAVTGRDAGYKTEAIQSMTKLSHLVSDEATGSVLVGFMHFCLTCDNSYFRRMAKDALLIMIPGLQEVVRRQLSSALEGIDSDEAREVRAATEAAEEPLVLTM